LDALHPGVERVFGNSSDVVRQHDSSSCGVIVCFTALQVKAGRPTNDVAFDSTRWRLVIYNTITAQRAEFANANTTHPTGTAHADRVASGHAVCDNATQHSTLRTRAAKRSGPSVEGIGTPKRVATTTRARKRVAPENAATAAARKQFRAAGAELPPSFRLGEMDKPSPNCAALHFAKEAFVCCSAGRVSVPSISQPKLFKDLYGGLHLHSKSFVNNMRNINSSLFAMASLTANEEQIAGGMQVHKISGEVYVNVSALYEGGPRPTFANYHHYDVDEANELRKCTACGAQLQLDLLVDVDRCLRENDGY
uniref:ULP_PROTEASE domain-containing protein n=1 Tax=Toxocara canis TaxID=6265 RepID=A0A183VGH8_TOXCA